MPAPRSPPAVAQTFFSFEFFPPKTEEGVEALWEKMETMVALQPMFCDITWGAGGSTADLTLDIAANMQNTVRGVAGAARRRGVRAGQPLTASR